MLNCRNIDEVLSMKKRGHSIDETDRFGNTLVQKAIFYNDIPFLEGLLKNGASARIRNFKGETPIFSIRKNNQVIEKILLDYVGPIIYTDVNNQNKNYFAHLFENNNNNILYNKSRIKKKCSL